MSSSKTKRRTKSLNRHNNKFRKTRRSKSAERYTNINAEKIGEGGFGIVSRPPARCAHFFSESSKNINQRNINSTVFQETYYKNPNYISKLGEWDSAIKEFKIGEIVKNNIKDWRNYYCFIEFICGAPKEKQIQIGPDEFQDTYAIAPYCGITLNTILLENYYMNPKELCNLIDALKELVIGLGKLHRLQIYHQDIHDENILFNPKDGKLRWIDFGLTLDLFDDKKKFGNNWEKHPSIITAKHFDTENLIYYIIEPTLVFIYYRLNTLKKSGKLDKSLEKCYEQVKYYLDIIPEEPQNLNYPNQFKAFNKYIKFKTTLKNTHNNFVVEFIKDFNESKNSKS